MASDVTRAEFDALAARVSALDGKTPPPTSTTGPTGAPVTPVPTTPYTTSTPTVKVEGSAYSISAQVTANSAATFTYLQLAVRGDGAKDLAMTPNKTLKAGETWNLIGNSTGSGSYTTWVALSLDGKTWVDGPKASFTTTAKPATPATPTTPTTTPTGKASVALVGKSGLDFNSLVFRTSASAAEQFGQRRGVAMDGFMYFTGRQTWSDFRWLADGMRDWLQQGRIVVMTMPHAPESEGASMNSRGANDAYKSQQRDLGKYLADSGVNLPNLYIRTAWECNGNWYAWSIKNGGAEALKQSIKNYVTNLRGGGATKVKFSMCNNKGPSQSGASAFDAFPGAEYINNMGIDQYDMWGPARNAADWERECAKNPSARSTAAFARQHGITWSWDEGGNTHGDGNMGGDNPTYWDLRVGEIRRSIDNFAFDVTYDDRGAPATLMHDFANNPKSFDRYKQLYRPA